MPISEALLPEFDQEIATTRKYLERIPDDKFDWKPHEKSMTLGRLSAHIAEIVGWGGDVMVSTEFNVAPPGQEAPKPWLPNSRAEILEQFEKHVVTTRKAIAATPDAEFAVDWALLAGDQTIFKMPRIAVYRGMIMNHMIHHRAQLSVYLRLNGVPVPATYGPSADEQ